MKNLISSFIIFNFKKHKEKKSNEKTLVTENNLKHYRRDLDSIG